LHEPVPCQACRAELCYGILTKELFQRRSFRVEPDEDKPLPCSHGNRDEAVGGAIEVAYAREVGRAQELAVETVGPAVIGTAHAGGLAPGLGHHGRRMVPADVEEGT